MGYENEEKEPTQEERLRAVEMQLKMLLNENKDSITCSTAAKGGEIKVYLNFSKLEECKNKIDNALQLRAYANEKLNGVGI